MKFDWLYKQFTCPIENCLFQLNWNFKTTAQITTQRDKSYLLKGSGKAIIYQKSMSLVLISYHLINKISITVK